MKVLVALSCPTLWWELGCSGIWEARVNQKVQEVDIEEGGSNPIREARDPP